MSNGHVFTAWYEQELRDIRKMKKGVPSNEIVIREEWQRLPLVTRTILQLFFNAANNCADDVRHLDSELVRHIQRQVAPDILVDPDVRKVIDLFLGAETPEGKL